MGNYSDPSIPQTLLIALVGFITVFVVLIVLMCLIVLISKLFGEKQKAPADAPAPAEPAPAVAAEPEPVADAYTGVKLHGIDDKTAAILMAIVADDLNKPLDNLRFISIKEVK